MSEHVRDKCKAYTSLLNATASQEMAANYSQGFQDILLKGEHLP